MTMPASDTTLVVSDTSPVRALAHLQHLDLLERLYGRVLVPPAVEAELLNPARPTMPVVRASELKYVEVVAPRDTALVRAFRDDGGLDAGESEALALAIEVGVTLILMDEARGRREAERRG